MSKHLTERPIEELTAGNDFRLSLVPRADGDRIGAPLWFGWALMDAFLAGVDYGRQTASTTQDDIEHPHPDGRT